MARIIHDDQGSGSSGEGQLTVIHADGQSQIQLPDADFMAKGEILRDGQDLVLQSSDGTEVVIENYFSAMPAPLLTTPHGSILTPELVQSFVKSDGPVEYAANATENDASAVGIIKEVSGDATITRADGSSEKVVLGMDVHQGDIVETSGKGAVNIVFLDESSFSISNNARLAIDEYVFDPATQAGETNVSILRGMFVFTSGLIGRDDPDDVKIDTPVGSIGIRGTTIAGHIQPDGESVITVVEGAIVITNGAATVTLSEQYETVKLTGFDQQIQIQGTLDSSEMKDSYGMIGTVNAGFFNTLNEGAAPAPEGQDGDAPVDAAPSDAPADAPTDAPATTDESAAEAEAPVVATYDIYSDPADTSFEKNLVDRKTLEQVVADSKAIAVHDDAVRPTTLLSPKEALLQAKAEAPRALPPLELVVEIKVDVDAQINQAVGKAFTTIPYPDAMMTFLNVPKDANGDAFFTLVKVGPGVYNIVLTEAGFDDLADRDPGENFGAVRISVTLQGGRTDVAIAPALVVDFDSGVGNPPPADLHLNSLTLAPETNGYKYNGAYGLGESAAFLGDFNHDGDLDFAVTGGAIDGQIFLSDNSGYNPGGDRTFLNVAGGGDINGDGYLDMVSGRPEEGGWGVVNTFYGGPTAMSFQITQNGSAGDNYGASLAMVDFNGDGKSDVFIGASGGGTMGHGEVIKYNLSGGFTDGFMNGSAPTDASTGNLGFTMTSLTDYNGDGFGDFAVGGKSDIDSGYVKIFMGNAAGTASTFITLTGVDVDNNEMPLFDMGDVNGDGKSDLMIGSTAGSGAAYLFYGGHGTGNMLTANVTIKSGPSFELVGAGSAGDFNGDGFDDIFVATRNVNGTGTGVDAYIIYGAETGLPSMIDVNTFTTNNPENSFHMTLDLNGVGGLAGGDFSLLSTAIGDQNGDGFDDILLASTEMNNDAGGYFVVHGRAETAQVTAGTVHIASPNATADSAGDSLIGNNGNNTLADNIQSNISFSAGGGDDTMHIQGALTNSLEGGMGIDSAYLHAANVDLRNISHLSGVEHFVFQSSSNQTLTLGLNDIFSLLQSSDLIESGIYRQIVFEADNDADTGSAGQETLTIDNAGAGSGILTSVNTGLQASLGLTYAGSAGGMDKYMHGSGYQILIDTEITVNVI